MRKIDFCIQNVFDENYEEKLQNKHILQWIYWSFATMLKMSEFKHFININILFYTRYNNIYATPSHY